MLNVEAKGKKGFEAEERHFVVAGTVIQYCLRVIRKGAAAIVMAAMAE